MLKKGKRKQNWKKAEKKYKIEKVKFE